jgi:hypothetical protein
VWEVEQLKPAQRKARKGRKHFRDMSWNQKVAVTRYHEAIKRVDAAKMGLANKRLNGLDEVDEVDGGGGGQVEIHQHQQQSQNVPGGHKLARSPSPGVEVRPSKRVRLDEAGTGIVVESNDGDRVKRKVSFNVLFDRREVLGYRKPDKYYRFGKDYERGRHAASPGCYLGDTSGCHQFFEMFYVSDGYDNDEWTDDEEVEVPDSLKEASEVEEGSAGPEKDQGDTKMVEGIDGEWETETSDEEADDDDADWPDADPSELVRWHDDETDEDGIDEGIALDDQDRCVEVVLNDKADSIDDSGFAETWEEKRFQSTDPPPKT